MALIKGIGLFLVGLVTGVLSRVIGDELAANAPTLARRIAQIAVGRLPESQRERFDEEWQGHINEIPGNILKLCSAASLLLKARKIGRIAASAEDLLESRLQLVSESDASLLKVASALRLIDRKMGSAPRDVRNRIRPHVASVRSEIKKYRDLRGAWISEIEESVVPCRYRIIQLLRSTKQRRADSRLSRNVKGLNQKAELISRQLGGGKRTKQVR